MLDISYYEKTDEIIAQYTCDEKSLIRLYRGFRKNIAIFHRSFNLCCGETGNLRGESLQCGKFL